MAAHGKIVQLTCVVDFAFDGTRQYRLSPRARPAKRDRGCQGRAGEGDLRTHGTGRREAIQAQWETATVRLGAEASGLSEPRYREVRDRVNHVLSTLGCQRKIDGPLSIDLERAHPETKARVSGDAFAELPPVTAAALRTRMDRLVPVWSQYKKLVAVAG